MRLKTWHCLSLLALAVLLAYYPSLSAGYNSVDDLKMITNIDQSGLLDLQRLFVRSGSYYYRPLTILSYTLDRDLWGSIPSFMHLENILLHLVCTLLVFAITRRLLSHWGIKEKGLALFAALFFALHPIATESVSWISGRTDPLMAVFLLLAVWLTLLALSSGRHLTALYGGLALLLACLAKEVAVFILPGLLWLIVVYPGPAALQNRLRRRFWMLLMPTAGIAGYFVLRHLAIARDSGISTALKGVTGGDYDLLNKVRVAFKVYGFYFKKLLIPWPLNFGIIKISDWYVLAGILLVALLLYLLWRADVVGAFGIMAFCVLSPALLVVFGNMTWTPLAERYLYTSAALFAPLAAFTILRLQSLVAVQHRRRLDLALTALLLVFFATTLHRSWIWQDNLRLYQDTVAKSPDFSAAKTELASALLRKGRSTEAEEVLVGMQGGSNTTGYINDDMNLAEVLLSRGEVEEARAILLPLLNMNPKKYYDVLQALLRTNDQRIDRVETPDLRLAIQQESLDWLEEQQRLRPNAFTVYRIAKLQLAMGDKMAALTSFRAALAKAPTEAHYRGAAQTFIKKLESL
ncbi:MAG: tetratricopeptide repeat protein [Desulfuromonadales bacterium]